jgi:hypothetical protein
LRENPAANEHIEDVLLDGQPKGLHIILDI